MFQLNSESFDDDPMARSNEFLSHETKSDFRDYLTRLDSRMHMSSIKNNSQIQQQKKVLTRRKQPSSARSIQLKRVSSGQIQSTNRKPPMENDFALLSQFVHNEDTKKYKRHSSSNLMSSQSFDRTPLKRKDSVQVKKEKMERESQEEINKIRQKQRQQEILKAKQQIKVKEDLELSQLLDEQRQVEAIRVENAKQIQALKEEKQRQEQERLNRERQMNLLKEKRQRDQQVKEQAIQNESKQEEQNKEQLKIIDNHKDKEVENTIEQKFNKEAQEKTSNINEDKPRVKEQVVNTSLDKSFCLMKTSGVKRQGISRSLLRKNSMNQSLGSSMNMSTLERSGSNRDNVLFLKKNTKSGYYEQVVCLLNNFRRLDQEGDGQLPLHRVLDVMQEQHIPYNLAKVRRMLLKYQFKPNQAFYFYDLLTLTFELDKMLLGEDGGSAERVKSEHGDKPIKKLAANSPINYRIVEYIRILHEEQKESKKANDVKEFRRLGLLIKEVKEKEYQRQLYCLDYDQKQQMRQMMVKQAVVLSQAQKQQSTRLSHYDRAIYQEIQGLNSTQEDRLKKERHQVISKYRDNFDLARCNAPKEEAKMQQQLEKRLTIIQRNHSLEKENLLMKIQRERNNHLRARSQEMALVKQRLLDQRASLEIKQKKQQNNLKELIGYFMNNKDADLNFQFQLKEGSANLRQRKLVVPRDRR